MIWLFLFQGFTLNSSLKNAWRRQAAKKSHFNREEAVKCLEKGKIAVLGGLKPGMTTDTVAALVAEKIKS
jgi:uridylate kinase